MLISVVRRLFHSLQCVCLWWHSSIPFNAQENPLRPGISHPPLLFQHPRDGPGKHLISYPNTLVCTRAQMYVHIKTHAQTCSCQHKNNDTHSHAHSYTQAHTYTTNHHLHTQYLLLFHIAVNPVKKLCGERK